MPSFRSKLNTFLFLQTHSVLASSNDAGKQDRSFTKTFNCKATYTAKKLNCSFFLNLKLFMKLGKYFQLTSLQRLITKFCVRLLLSLTCTIRRNKKDGGMMSILKTIFQWIFQSISMDSVYSRTDCSLSENRNSHCACL